MKPEQVGNRITHLELKMIPSQTGAEGLFLCSVGDGTCPRIPVYLPDGQPGNGGKKNLRPSAMRKVRWEIVRNVYSGNWEGEFAVMDRYRTHLQLEKDSQAPSIGNPFCGLSIYLSRFLRSGKVQKL